MTQHGAGTLEEDFALSLPTGTVAAEPLPGLRREGAGHRRRLHGRARASRGEVRPSLDEPSVPLAPATTLGVAARALVSPRREAEADVAARPLGVRARRAGLPTLVLGGGSNLLVGRSRLRRARARPASRGAARATAGAGRRAVEVEAGAGERWDDLVARAVASGWAGVECLSGIPGEVGATPIQNVGAYGQEVAETIVRVRAIDRETGAAVEPRRARRCGFGYRDSVFKREDAGRFVIVAVTLRAPPRRRARAALRRARRRARRPRRGPSLAEVREPPCSNCAARKSMVLDPGERERPERRVVLHEPGRRRGRRRRGARAGGGGRCARAGERMPEHAAPGGRVKLLGGVAHRAGRLPQGDGGRGRGDLDAARARDREPGRRDGGGDRRASRGGCARACAIGSGWRSTPSRCWSASRAEKGWGRGALRGPSHATRSAAGTGARRKARAPSGQDLLAQEVEPEVASGGSAATRSRHAASRAAPSAAPAGERSSQRCSFPGMPEKVASMGRSAASSSTSAWLSEKGVSAGSAVTEHARAEALRVIAPRREEIGAVEPEVAAPEHPRQKNQLSQSR